MNFFATKTEIAPVELTVEGEKIQLEQTLRARLRELDSELEKVSLEARDWREWHCIVVAGELALKAATLDAREALENEWRDLEMKAAAIALERTSLMKEWSELTTNPREVSSRV